MVEGIPSEPYSFLPRYWNIVQTNMNLRRTEIQQLLSERSDCQHVLSITNFPR